MMSPQSTTSSPGSGTSGSPGLQDSVVILGEKKKSLPKVVDVEADTTLETEVSNENMDTSNESGSKGGDYSVSPSDNSAFSRPVRPPLMVIPTPPLSTSSSRAGSMTTNRPGSDSIPNESTDPYLNPVAGPSCTPISFHSNIPTDRDPQHVLVKATKDLIQVKILTFKAYNIQNIVQCFFDERIETDNPGASLESSFEDAVNSSTSSGSSREVVKNIFSKFLNSSLQVFYKPTPDNTPSDSNDEIVLEEPEEEGMEQEEGDNGGEGEGNAS